MLLFSVLVAGSFALGSRIANDIDPRALTALRFAIGAATLVTVAVLRGSYRRGDLAAPWRYAILGAAMATYFVLMFDGLKTSPSVSIAAVFTLTPIMSAVFGWLLLRQITTGWMALALLVGAMGAIWVIFRADVAAVLAFDIGRGEMVFFIGCAAHALYAPLVPKLNRGESTDVFTAGMLVAGSLLLIAVSFNQLIALNWSAMPIRVWWVLAYLAVVTTAITFFLVQFAALRLPASKVMAYTYITPTVVILWEILLGGGVPSAAILAGVTLTVSALLMLLRE